MKKRKIRSTMGVFLTTFLLLQIILLFLYKSFIVEIAKKNEKNLVENTLQIYHNTMEGVLERLDDNLPGSFTGRSTAFDTVKWRKQPGKSESAV